MHMYVLSLWAEKLLTSNTSRKMTLAILKETVSLKFDLQGPEIKCELFSDNDVPSFPEMPFMQVYSSCLGADGNSNTLKDFDRAVRHVSAG